MRGISIYGNLRHGGRLDDRWDFPAIGAPEDRWIGCSTLNPTDLV